MKKLKGISQNKKIAISAISIFLVSLSMMMFFLGKGSFLQSGEANVLHSTGGSTSAHGAAAGGNEAVAIEDSYRKDLKNIEDPIFVLTPAGKFTFTSDSFCKLVNKKCDTLTGKLFYNLINSKDLPALISSVSDVLAKKERVDSMGPYRMISGDHELIVMFNVVPVLGENKEVKSLAFSIKDLTAQVQNLDSYKSLKADDAVKTTPAADDWLKALYPKIQEMKDSKMAKA